MATTAWVGKAFHICCMLWYVMYSWSKDSTWMIWSQRSFVRHYQLPNRCFAQHFNGYVPAASAMSESLGQLMVRWNARPHVSLRFWLFWHCCRWPSSRETCYVRGSQPHPARPNGQTCHWKPRRLRSFRNKLQKVQFWKTCKLSALWILNMNIIWYVLIHWIGIVNVIPTSPYLK